MLSSELAPFVRANVADRQPRHPRQPPSPRPKTRRAGLAVRESTGTLDDTLLSDDIKRKTFAMYAEAVPVPTPEPAWPERWLRSDPSLLEVLPMAYGHDGEHLYLHGAVANHLLGEGEGREVCVTVTCLDGLVVARTPFHNSMNYRS